MTHLKRHLGEHNVGLVWLVILISFGSVVPYFVCGAGKLSSWSWLAWNFLLVSSFHLLAPYQVDILHCHDGPRPIRHVELTVVLNVFFRCFSVHIFLAAGLLVFIMQAVLSWCRYRYSLSDITSMKARVTSRAQQYVTWTKTVERLLDAEGAARPSKAFLLAFCLSVVSWIVAWREQWICSTSQVKQLGLLERFRCT